MTPAPNAAPFPPPRTRRHARWRLLAATVLMGSSVTASAGLLSSALNWRAAWGASPSNALTSQPLAATEAIRMVVRVSASGSLLRLRLTQRYGVDGAGLSGVTVGRRGSDGAIVPGSLRNVTFFGLRSVRIPAGATVTSDPVALSVSAFDDLVISIGGRLGSLQLTEHAVARDYSYFSAGQNALANPDGSPSVRAPAANLDAIFLLEGVDVAHSTAERTLVALGDSITDGYVSTGGFSEFQDTTQLGRNERYPDFLAQRLATQFPGRYSVINAGISGNRVAAGPFLPNYGPSLLDRLDADVLAVPGVTDVILMEGGNDIGFGQLQGKPDPAAVIAGLTQAVQRIKAGGLRVLLGTIPSRTGFFAGLVNVPTFLPGDIRLPLNSDAAQAARSTVNDWIRTQQLADGVVDFEACLRDPAQPDRLAPAYDSGDHLHPNAAGYAAMANCVDLSLLQ